MDEEDLGLELMQLYRRLRQAFDPAVKAVIRRRIDSLLAADARSGSRALPARRNAENWDSGAD